MFSYHQVNVDREFWKQHSALNFLHKMDDTGVIKLRHEHENEVEKPPDDSPVANEETNATETENTETIPPEQVQKNVEVASMAVAMKASLTLLQKELTELSLGGQRTMNLGGQSSDALDTDGIVLWAGEDDDINANEEGNSNAAGSKSGCLPCCRKQKSGGEDVETGLTPAMEAALASKGQEDVHARCALFRNLTFFPTSVLIEL